MLGAALYLWSAALYPTEAGPTDAATLTVHRIETAAAGIELLACVGWLITWHLTYVRVPGRGYTLDDPDVWAMLTIFAGSMIYLTYNIQILRHPEWYLSNELFYASNGVLYLLASLRDDGWFFFMPLAGGFPDPAGQARLYSMVYKAEKRQCMHEALEAGEKHAKGGETGGGLASAMVALIVPEEEEVGAGYDVV